ncbi:MAG TPA: C39 family peptidase [Dactylosporangium sp.]|nr:C39 family peptidase [Dactylosporangium sp.]
MPPLSYFYKSRHSQPPPSARRPLGRRLPVAVAAASLVLAAAAGIGVATLDRHPASDAQSLAGSESTLDGISTSSAARAKRGDAPPPAAAPTSTKPSASSSPAPSSPSASPTPTQPSQKDVSYQFAWQENYYYCGPAATRIALTARGLFPSQSQVAERLGTTESGTNSSEDTARALNSFTGTNFYEPHFIRGESATAADVDELRKSVVSAIGSGYAVVANISGSTVDDAGHSHAYPGGHYLTIVGYRDNGETVRIADPADAEHVGAYTLPVAKMANWIAQRGYAA